MASADVPRASEVCCGYCLQKLDLLEDPRTLPCTHICCMECLEADFRKLNVTECPVCKAVHRLNVKTLPPYQVRPASAFSLHQKTGHEYKATPCDVCSRLADGEVMRASHYCYDCEKKLCPDHLKKHDEFHHMFSKGGHKTSTMASYTESRIAAQSSEKCKSHPDEAVKITCIDCFEFFCDDCNLQTLCTATTAAMNSKHRNLQSINSIVSQITAKSESFNRQITEIAAQRKEILQQLDNRETEVDKTILKLENAKANHVKNLDASIKTCIAFANKELTRLNSYKDKCNDDVNQKLVRNTERMEQHTVQWRQLQEILKTANQTDLVRQHKSLMSRLDAALPTADLKLDVTCRFPPLPDISVELDDFLAGDSVGLQPPTAGGPIVLVEGGSLTAVTSFGGEFTWATIKGVKQRNRKVGNFTNIQSIKAIGRKNEFIVLAGPSGSVNVAHNIWKIKLSSQFGSSSVAINMERLASFDRNDDFQAHLDIANESGYMYTTRPSAQLHVFSCFDQFGREVFTKKLYGMKQPLGIRYLSETHVLISDYGGDSVSKVPLGPKYSYEWTCCGIPKPTGITTDDEGLIYVGSYSAKLVFILSPRGEILSSIKTGRFGNIIDVCLTGDTLAVASKTVGLATIPLKRSG